MMRTTISFVVTLLFISLAGCNSAKLADLEKENKELRNQVETLKKRPSLEALEKCARQASLVARLYEEVNATNHYQMSSGKCFVQLEIRTVEGKKGVYVNRVVDAFEGKVYGRYIPKAIGDIAAACQVFKDGRLQDCSSREEFDSVMKIYMND